MEQAAWIGYHASHEMLPPSRLLREVVAAERAGFDGAMGSDHFHPWSSAQGQSGQSWPWMGAALASTRSSLGVVTAPGQRQHPAMVAQAIATLGELFPGRVWAALGSGENLNEHITGQSWPSKPERNARLEESAHVIRRLLSGEEVSVDGPNIVVDRARLWSRPAKAPPLLAAALSADTARRTAQWSDGLITTGSLAAVRKVVRAYKGRAPGKPVFVQVQVGWGGSDEEAVVAAHRLWRFAALPTRATEDVATTEEYDRLAAAITPAQVARRIHCSSNAESHAEHLLKFLDLGVDRIYVHGIADRAGFVPWLGREVLPRVRDVRGLRGVTTLRTRSSRPRTPQARPTTPRRGAASKAAAARRR